MVYNVINIVDIANLLCIAIYSLWLDSTCDILGRNWFSSYLAINQLDQIILGIPWLYLLYSPSVFLIFVVIVCVCILFLLGSVLLCVVGSWQNFFLLNALILN